MFYWGLACETFVLVTIAAGIGHPERWLLLLIVGTGLGLVYLKNVLVLVRALSGVRRAVWLDGDYLCWGPFGSRVSRDRIVAIRRAVRRSRQDRISALDLEIILDHGGFKRVRTQLFEDRDRVVDRICSGGYRRTEAA